MSYKMKIINEKESSAKYGNCEKCGQYCAEVYHVFGFDGNKYRDLFGCRECCEAVLLDAENKINFYFRRGKILPRIGEADEL